LLPGLKNRDFAEQKRKTFRQKKEESNMIARVYAELIRKGKKTLGDVPKSLQEAVQVELNRQGTIGNE